MFEILFKMLLFKGGVLIYAEHCIYIYIYNCKFCFQFCLHVCQLGYLGSKRPFYYLCQHGYQVFIRLHTTIQYRIVTKINLINISIGSYMFTNNITIIIKQYDEQEWHIDRFTVM